MSDFASDDIPSGYNNFQAFGAGKASCMSQPFASYGRGQSSECYAVHKSPAAAQSSWRGRGFYPSSKPAAASAPRGSGFAAVQGGFECGFGYSGVGDGPGLWSVSSSGCFRGGFGSIGSKSFNGSRGGAPGGGSSGSSSYSGCEGVGASGSVFNRGRGKSSGRKGLESRAFRQEAINRAVAPPGGYFRQRPWEFSSSEKAPSKGGTKRPTASLSTSAWLPPAKERAEKPWKPLEAPEKEPRTPYEVPEKEPRTPYEVPEKEPRKPFKVPDTAPENFKQLVKSMQCSLCNARVNSIVSAEVHYNSKPHQQQLRESGLPAREYFSGVLFVLANQSADGSTQSASNLELPTGELDTRYCKLCDATFTNSVQMYQHYAGKKHRKNAKDDRKVAKARLA